MAWPPANGLTTQRVPRLNVILPIHASTTVAAPASLVWSTLRDLSDFPTWNTFCPSATIHSQPKDAAESEANLLHLDTSFTFNVIMDASKPSKITPTQLRVTDFSTPDAQSGYIPADVLKVDGTYEADLGKVYRIAWSTEGGFVARGLRSERFHEIIVLGENQCEVRTWECQGGVLARAVKYYYKDTLMKKFAEWCEDLKRESERRAQNEATG
ncbi:hypothetical protein N7G274_005375 [Stereocaulon virgatum]|uniref:Coenzyme Q-binding protein COQ10 START domain-containing protein n=1 Tax=Stereocaulon virgatum TaxID=373712 RepID=A0ABR4A8J0_9LECA